MFFFHGHTLVVSLFLKNEARLPAGLPRSLVLEVLQALVVEYLFYYHFIYLLAMRSGKA